MGDMKKHLILSAVLMAAGVACASEGADGWRVGEVGGAPGLLRGGRPVAPLLFWQAVPEEEDVRALSAAGVGFYSCFTAGLHYKNPYWREDGRVAPEFQERTLDALFGWNPSAAVLPRLFATAPDWWIAANPGEAVRWSNPHPAPGRDVPVRESFASRKARDEVAPRYAQAVRQLMAKYGDRLMGIHVTNGPWGENFSWEAFTIAGWPDYPAEESGFGDVSAAMTAAFRGYLREKYGTVGALRKAWRDDEVDFSTAEVPGMAERFRLNGEGWRDPAAGRRVPDYFECMNRVTVDMLDFYAGIVKEVSGGRLPTVVFYGYTQDERRTLECDHRAISRAYRSRNLDCFSAPHTYHRRRPGEDGEMRQYLASAALHGKLFIDEGDDMTYLERLKESPDCRAFSKDVDESLAVLYREFGMTLTHGVGLWFMDLTGGNFRDRRIVDAVGRCRMWSEESLALPRTHLSEVAVVSQPESEFYMGYRQTPANRISEALYLEEMGAYYRTGAPFDWYLAEDLEAVRARKYKVVALLDCEYLSAEQYATLLKMKEEGVRFVFYHAPGYVSQTDLDWERVRALTGGEEYRDLRRHSAAELRGIFREAGAHVYTDTDDVVLSANESHVMLHSRKAGDYVVRLKGWSAAEELVSGREVEVRDGCCTIRMDACRTAILRKLDGTLALALHQPNNPPNERPRFFDIEESGGSLRIRSNADK